MELRLNVQGASELEIARGIKAAKDVFESSGIGPFTASQALFALEGWDIAGFPDEGDSVPTDQDHLAAEVWLEANEAATTACCDGWTESCCLGCELELVMSDAEIEALHRLGGDDDDWPLKTSDLQQVFEDEFNSAVVVNHPGNAPKAECHLLQETRSVTSR